MTTVEEKLAQANQHHQNGRLQHAAALYQKIIQIRSNHPEALHGLGVIAYQQKNYDRALELIDQAIAQHPDIAQFYYNLGLVWIALEKPRKAMAAFEAAISKKNDYAEAYYNLGNILKSMRKLEEAIENYRQAIAIQPQFVEAHYNLGNALKFSGCLEEAIACFQECIRLKTDFPEPHNNIGLVLKEQGRLEAAIDCYSRAIDLQPQFAAAHWNRALALLLQGDFAHGWREYEWRFRRGKWPRRFLNRQNVPQWDGSPFCAQRLLVFAEQGIGDTLQFIRYLPQVKALGGTVIFETMASLFELLKGFEGIDELLVRNPEQPSAVACDWCIPLLSLPRLFNSDLDTIPAPASYLAPDPAKTRRWRTKICQHGFRVGIVWAGRPEHENDHHRSCALEYFMPLAQMEGIRLYGLQKGESARQVRKLPDRRVVENLGEDFENFADTAGAVENLDLVISVDTAVAHLAGAMGKPVWLLLPFAPDWRWLMHREDSPWYPAMRLFRQKSRGDWAGVFQRVASELENLSTSYKYVD
ncbi:MAG: glycosyltransferase family protein [Desulfobacterales bacterium]|nr:MAG: glycosyltransferase family protein [Desulfobacterales bacterium]